MTKAQATQAFWTAISTIYIGGIVLYFSGDKPRTRFQRDIIPVSEPTAVDWAQIGGIMFLT